MELSKEQLEFKTWFEGKYHLTVEFIDDAAKPVNVVIPGRSCGRSVPLVIAVAWEAWKESRRTVR